jgi:hypothetical protein
MRRFAAAFVVAIAAASLAGCGRAGAKVQNGIEYYEHGAYEGALLKFRAMEADESSLRTKTRARYLVYRGLAHWHVKQNDDARRYLQEARKSFEGGGDPKWLPSDVREELAKAESELGLDQPTLPAKPGLHPAGHPHPGPAGSSPPDRPSPPGTPPGPPDGTPTPPPDKPGEPPATSPSGSPSSPTSSPPGPAPGPALPPNTTPSPEPM